MSCGAGAIAAPAGEAPASEEGVDAAGLVRPARRPAGWLAPGPPPRRTAERSAPRAGEDLCHLSGDWRILQRLDGNRWSLDDLVTAWVAAGEMTVAPPRRVVDLGCGIGSVLLMMAWRFPEARVLGVEAQAVSVDLARRSIAWNGIRDRCEVCLGDLRDREWQSEAELFDLVTGTPPYLPRGTALESRRVQSAPCHFEHRGGVEEYCLAASALLAAGGRFVTCAGAAQQGRVEDGAAAAGLRLLRRLEVIPREGKAPLFCVHVLAAGAAASAQVAATSLTVRARDGRWTDGFRSLRHDMGLPA